FKFCSYNIYGRATQDISTATAYTYTVAAPAVTATTMVARGNATISGEDYFKLTGASTAWDSDCVATSVILAGNVSAQWVAGRDALGFVTSTGSTANPGTNMYAIFPDVTGVLVIENGTTKYTGAAPALGDLYDVRYDGFTLHYYINGVNVWNTPLQGASLYPAFAFYDPSASLSNVQVLAGTLATPTQWRGINYGVVSNKGIGKTGGGLAWDSGAVTVNGYNSCYITAKANNT